MYAIATYTILAVGLSSIVGSYIYTTFLYKGLMKEFTEKMDKIDPENKDAQEINFN